MSGHSKWANIKRKKEANDKARGAVFAKLSHLITIAVAEGGGLGDPDHNFKLRLAVDKARNLNMPKDNIQRAIDKALGSDKNMIREVIYEAFASQGVALMIQATTDSPNRTVSGIKNVLERNNGKLGSQGSVSYLFQKCVAVVFDKPATAEDSVFTFASKLDAIDIDEDKASYTVYVPFDHFGKIKEHLDGLSPQSTEVEYRPNSLIKVSDDKTAKSILQLAEALESLEDVHRVFFNLDIPESLIG